MANAIERDMERGGNVAARRLEATALQQMLDVASRAP
jgi:hypothetical protein